MTEDLGQSEAMLYALFKLFGKDLVSIAGMTVHLPMIY